MLTGSGFRVYKCFFGLGFRGPLTVCTLHCAGMRGKLPDVIKLPPSVTVPFGSFEEALKLKENKDVSKRLEEAVKAIPNSHAEEQLTKCRDIVMEVPLFASHLGSTCPLEVV